MRGKKPDSRQRAEIRRFGRYNDGHPLFAGDWLVVRETSEYYILENKYKRNAKIKVLKKSRK